MSRVSFRSRRGRVVLVFLACALLTVAWALLSNRQVVVAIYNDTDETWPGATLSVGRAVRHLQALRPREDVAESFAAEKKGSNMELSVEGARIIHWSAPYLIQGDTARVAVHVNRLGEITATAEPRPFSRILKFLE